MSVTRFSICPAPLFTPLISSLRFERIFSSIFARMPKSSFLFKYLSSSLLVKSPFSSIRISAPTASSGLTIFVIIRIITAIRKAPIVIFTAAKILVILFEYFVS